MVDTNVLVYATIDAAPRCEETRQWVAGLQRDGMRLSATPQIYREYLVVLTRGPVFDRTFTPSEALDALAVLRRSLLTLVPTRATLDLLCDLVDRYAVQGKRVHDAHIVATMLTYGVDALATYNESDFIRFDAIRLLARPSDSSGDEPTV